MYSITLYYPLSVTSSSKLSRDLDLLAKNIGPTHRDKWYISCPYNLTRIEFIFAELDDFVWFKLAIAADHQFIAG